MDLFLRIDINLIAMFMLVMVFLIAQKRLDQKDVLNKSYMFTIVLVFIQLGVESITCLINGKKDIEFQIISNILHVILYVIAPLLTGLWYILVRRFVAPRKKLSNKHQFMIFLPAIVSGILSILSPFLGIYFKITSEGLYERGSYFLLAIILTHGYFIASIIHIIRYRSKLVINEMILLILFSFLPIVGAILQGLFYGIILAWSTAAFSLVIVYLYLQERLVHLDIMTGVWTRRSFDYYMDKRLKQKIIDPFGCIYFDIDHLKTINDAFGHAEGDFAITEIISRIKGLVRQDEVVARLGGDEFIIVVGGNTLNRLTELISDIQLSLSIFNENADKKYKLSCSFGYGLYSSEFKSMDEFLRFIDHQMYESKHIEN